MQMISIVIPAYQEEQNLAALHKRLHAVIDKIDRYEWRLIFVNDGSRDRTFEVLAEIAKSDPLVTALDLSRNFGKEIALTAGVHEADPASDAIICIDADLQHPPELIPELIEKWQGGAEIVATVRTSIDNQPLLRRMGSRVYYWLMSKISGVGMVSQTTDFRLYDRKVISAFKRATERERLFRGIMDWMGFHKTYVEFKADARAGGQASYSYSKLWSLAIKSITSYSLLPLRLTGYLGVAITGFSGLLLVIMLGDWLLGNNFAFTPLAVVAVTNTLLIGIVLISIGLVALYIGTIHTEVINRPLYLVRERLGAGPSEQAGTKPATRTRRAAAKPSSRKRQTS